MAAPDSSRVWLQLVWLAILAIPVASVTWTVTHEEIFREPRELCAHRSQSCRRLLERKFFYVFTCEYCFSHYVTIFFLVLTGYRLLLDDWRGSLIAFFALAGVVNVYTSLYGRLRVDIKSERVEIAAKEKELGSGEQEPGQQIRYPAAAVRK